jgi:hypothetical protein
MSPLFSQKVSQFLDASFRQFAIRSQNSQAFRRYFAEYGLSIAAANFLHEERKSAKSGESGNRAIMRSIAVRIISNPSGCLSRLQNTRASIVRHVIVCGSFGPRTRSKLMRARDKTSSASVSRPASLSPASRQPRLQRHANVEGESGPQDLSKR